LVVASHESLSLMLADGLLSTESLLLAQVDATLHYVCMSRGLAGALGREVSEFSGKSVFRNGFSAKHQAAMQGVLDTGQADIIRNWTVKAVGLTGRTPAYWQWEMIPLPNRAGLLLWAQDVTERRLLESEVIAAAAQERREVGREINDHIGQLLAALSMKIKSLEFLLMEEDSEGTSVARELRELTTEAIGALRRISRRLYPVHVEQGGLISELQHLIEDTMDVYRITCQMTAPNHEPDMESVQGIHVHAIVKQAIRHAVHQAGAQDLTVEMSEEPDCFVVKIRHNGKSYQRLSTIEGYHLMTFHAHTIGGTVSIQGRKGEPVTFTGRFPRRIKIHS